MEMEISNPFDRKHFHLATGGHCNTTVLYYSNSSLLLFGNVWDSKPSLFGFLNKHTHTHTQSIKQNKKCFYLAS